MKGAGGGGFDGAGGRAVGGGGARGVDGGGVGTKGRGGGGSSKIVWKKTKCKKKAGRKKILEGKREGDKKDYQGRNSKRKNRKTGPAT